MKKQVTQCPTWTLIDGKHKTECSGFLDFPKLSSKYDSALGTFKWHKCYDGRKNIYDKEARIPSSSTAYSFNTMIVNSYNDYINESTQAGWSYYKAARYIQWPPTLYTNLTTDIIENKELTKPEVPFDDDINTHILLRDTNEWLCKIFTNESMTVIPIQRIIHSLEFTE